MHFETKSPEQTAAYAFTRRLAHEGGPWALPGVSTSTCWPVGKRLSEPMRLSASSGNTIGSFGSTSFEADG